jgi:hypothetical protein
VESLSHIVLSRSYTQFQIFKFKKKYIYIYIERERERKEGVGVRREWEFVYDKILNVAIPSFAWQSARSNVKFIYVHKDTILFVPK